MPKLLALNELNIINSSLLLGTRRSSTPAKRECPEIIKCPIQLIIDFPIQQFTYTWNFVFCPRIVMVIVFGGPPFIKALWVMINYIAVVNTRLTRMSVAPAPVLYQPPDSP